MNLSAIFSKTGKGVQEASGKTSNLSRADRAVLAAIDGKTPLTEVQNKFEKLAGPKFEALIQQFDKDGYIREVSSGSQPAPQTARPAAKAPPAKAAPAADLGDEGLDFTQALKLPPKSPAPAAPKPPPVDLAAAARADAERKAKEQQAVDYRARQEAEVKAKAEAEQKARAAAEAKAKAEAEAKARAEAEARSRAEAEAKARAEADAKTHAEADAKVKAAREAALRMASEAKAKAESEAKAKSEAAERDKLAAEERARKEAADKARIEAELNAKLEAERKAREEAERKAAEAVERARKELEEKAKRDAEELRQRLEAEMKAKFEEERKAREEEDRKRREAEDRRRKEEDEERAREDVKRRAREEADRKKREEEDRIRKEEDDRRRKEEDERRKKEANERRVREEAEREKRAEEDRKRREEEDRRRKEEDQRRAKEDAERRAREDADRKAKEESEARSRAAADAAASLPRIESVAPPPPPASPAATAPASAALGDLLGDLDSFGKREEEEQKAKEEAERQAKEAAARKAREEAERKAREEAERKAKEEAERKAKEEEERKAKEEEERKEREEEDRRRQEAAEAKRKAAEAVAAKRAADRAAKAAARKNAGNGGEEADVADDDIDMDDIKRDQKALAGRVAEQPASAVVAASGGRPKRWGRPVAIGLFALLVVGVGVLHVMPLSTADYEKAASEALGAPVKIGSARLSLITGVEVKFEGVAIGNSAKVRLARGFPEIGSLFGERKLFNRIELEGVSLSQSQLADALLGKASGANFRVGRVVIKQLNLEGPLKLPPLDVEATISGDGSPQSVRLSGGDKLLVQLSPKGNEVAFEISAGSLALPFVPALSLSEFGMKGTASRDGVTSSEFDGRAYDGVISGSARIKWGASWAVDGEVRVRAVKVAVFAPALVSDGKVDGRAAYTMSGSSPGQLYERARLQGEFKIDKGVLGSFDLTRALQTGGAQTAGRTVFNELSGQGVYDKGVVQLRDMTMSAGAMNAGASLDIDANGGLSGRIAADVKTPNQTLRAVLNVSGKVQDPVIRK